MKPSEKQIRDLLKLAKSKNKETNQQNREDFTSLIINKLTKNRRN